jgi:prephenate dehydratase
MTATTKIAYLGPAGTYSDEATHYFMEKLQLENAELVECVSFTEVFDSVERGRCDYGVVATENSIEGPVTACLDNFATHTNITILAETVLDIHHCLVMNPESNVADIKTILSHPQGLGQCRRYIAEHFPGRSTKTASSTADGVCKIMEDKTSAAIANSFAAKLYGAKVHESNIEDHFGNQTSFALIARQGAPEVFPVLNKKTSILLFLQQNKSGSLLMILSEFAYANINLTKIQSRPTKQALGDYMFFIDFEGSTNDVDVQTALNCLRLKLHDVKVLGSYPTI